MLTLTLFLLVFPICFSTSRFALFLVSIDHVDDLLISQPGRPQCGDVYQVDGPAKVAAMCRLSGSGILASL